MSRETLSFLQRDALLQAQARRIKAARLARIQAMERAAAAPDYFTWQRRRQTLRAAMRVVLYGVHGSLGMDPRADERGYFSWLAQRAA